MIVQIKLFLVSNKYIFNKYLVDSIQLNIWLYFFLSVQNYRECIIVNYDYIIIIF